MSSHITINNKHFYSSEIEFLTADSWEFYIWGVQQDPLVSTKLELLTEEEVLSIYQYNKHHGDPSWFKRNIGFDKLPQEYKFMEM